MPEVSIVTNGRANPEHKEVGRPLPGLHQPEEDNRRGQADLHDESMREPHLHRDQGLLQPSQAPFCNQGSFDRGFVSCSVLCSGMFWCGLEMSKWIVADR